VARPRKRKPKHLVDLMAKADEENIQRGLKHLEYRLQAHVALHGEGGPHPFSEEWIDLQAGTPARAYLDDYRRTGIPLDVSTAENPGAANEMWDYLEQHEEAGTLPLCIHSLHRPFSDRPFPGDLLQFLAVRGTNPDDVADVWTRFVRVWPAEGDGESNASFIYEYTSRQQGQPGSWGWVPFADSMILLA